MEELIKFRKTVILQILVTAALVAAVTVLLGYRAAAKGFVLGSLFSLVNFLFMFRHTAGRVGDSRKAASGKSFLSMIIRMALLAVPLYVAMVRPEIDLIWAVAGILNLQISILIYSQVLGRIFPAAGLGTQGR